MSKINSTELRILNFLQSYKHAESGLCTPSVKDIAQNCGVSRPYVRQLNRKLEADGYLTRTPCWGYDDGYEFMEGTVTSKEHAPTPIRRGYCFGDGYEFRGPNLYTLTRRAIGVLKHSSRAIMSTLRRLLGWAAA